MARHCVRKKRVHAKVCAKFSGKGRSKHCLRFKRVMAKRCVKFSGKSCKKRR